MDESQYEEDVQDARRLAKASEFIIDVILDLGQAAMTLGLGPAETLLAASAGPMMKSLALSLIRRRERVGVLGQTVLNESGLDEDTLAQRILNSEVLTELTLQCAEAAARSAWREKCEALGKVLAWGVRDDASIDETIVFVPIISDLDTLHVRALGLIAQPRPGTGQLEGGLVTGFVSGSELIEQWPALEPLLRPVLATLTRHALIHTHEISQYDIDRALHWSLTEAGARVLQILRAPPGDLEA